jgi:hypothetical protein
MFNITLQLIRKGEDRILLAPHIYFRLGFAFICAILLVGMRTSPGEPLPVTGLIILTAAVLAVFYDERWIFDRNTQSIEFRWGLLFIYRKRVYRFSDVETFTFITLQRGRVINPEDETARSGARYTLFGLITRGGEKRSIEMIKSRLAPGLRDKAELICDFCGLPLEREKPRGR